MKTKVLDQVYLMAACPVSCRYSNGRFDVGEPVGFFLVKPIIGRPIIGKTRVVGYSEAITGDQLCYTEYEVGEYGADYSLTSNDAIQHDMQSPDLKVGDVSWKINSMQTADRLLTQETLSEYYSKPKEQVRQAIESVRTACREAVKTNNLQRAFNKQ